MPNAPDPIRAEDGREAGQVAYEAWDELLHLTLTPWRSLRSEAKAIWEAIERKSAAPAAPRKGPTEEEIARALYDADNRNLRNVWQWDHEGLDQEHPGTRERYLRQARAIATLLIPADRGETQGVGDGWKPISTAPKDGGRILVFVCTRGSLRRGHAEIAWWGEHSDWGPIWLWRDGREVIGPGVATHWMPLPKPPSPDQNRGEPDQGGANTEAGR